jgi:hypothetical protein
MDPTCIPLANHDGASRRSLTLLPGVLDGGHDVLARNDPGEVFSPIYDEEATGLEVHHQLHNSG